MSRFPCVWWYARTRWCRSENWVIAPKREIETIYGLVISCMEDREAPSGADPGFFLKRGGGTTKELQFLRCLTLNLQPRLMFYFNTNKPQFFLFLHNTSCVRKPHRRSSRSYSPNISHMKDCTALKLGEAFCIFTFFHFPVSGPLHDRLWFLFLNAWLSENQLQNAPCTLGLRKAKGLRSWSCIEMCIIFKEGRKLLSVKPHPSATFSLTSYPKTIQKPNHPFTSKASFPVL